MADEQDITVVVAEMIGGKIVIFGMAADKDLDAELKGMTPVIDMQFLTKQEAFRCPFCNKAMISLGQPECPNPQCGVDFTSKAPAVQEKLSKVRVEQVYGTRMWNQRHSLKPEARINCDNIVAWSETEDHSETREAWFQERKEAAVREEQAKAERSGIVVATEAQARAMASQKDMTDKALRGPGDGAGGFKVVR